MYTGDAFSLSVNSVFLTYLYILVSFRRRNNVNQLLLYLQRIHYTLISEMNSCLSEFFGFCGLHLVSSTIRLSCCKSPTVLLDMHHLTCGISCLLHSVNLILFTPSGSPRPAHITSSQSPHSLSPLSLPRSFTPDLKVKTHLFHKSFPP